MVRVKSIAMGHCPATAKTMLQGYTDKSHGLATLGV
jgi:hypothetical protein